MIIYLAAAIDHKNHSEDIFKILGDRLAPALCFNPKGAFVNANPLPTAAQPKDDEFVATMNFTGIQNADLLLAYVEPGVQSFGVPMELMYAVAIGKPVIIVCDCQTFIPGIYARLFSNAIVSVDFLSLDKVIEIYKKLTTFGSAEQMEASYRKSWIRSLLKEK